MNRLIAIAVLLTSLGLSAFAQTADSDAGPLKITSVVTGLNDPWGFAFLPNGSVLITEKPGRLLMAKNGQIQTISGLPKISEVGQGGLLDVLVPRNFEQTNWVYLTYVVAQGQGYGTAMGRGKLSTDQNALTSFESLFEMQAFSGGGRHFGSRLAEGPDGSIYMTIGDRGTPRAAQDPGQEHGSVLKFSPNGAAPSARPFGVPHIWSIGHRNPQGLTLDAKGQLWAIEHGPKGGDEINFVQPGSNYGWPIIGYGVHYSGAKVGVGTQKPGLEQPHHYWDPSIAPSGAMVYSGKLWPLWRGFIFTGSLKFDSIHMIGSTRGATVGTPIQSPETKRVRDIREAPDGSIWFLNEIDGVLFKITPG